MARRCILELLRESMVRCSRSGMHLGRWAARARVVGRSLVITTLYAYSHVKEENKVGDGRSYRRLSKWWQVLGLGTRALTHVVVWRSRKRLVTDEFGRNHSRVIRYACPANVQKLSRAGKEGLLPGRVMASCSTRHDVSVGGSYRIWEGRHKHLWPKVVRGQTLRLGTD